MKRSLFFSFFLFLSFGSFAQDITVKNITELNEANKKAKPGDVITLQNGDWTDVAIKLNCSGTKEKPITFKAQNAGQVRITGKSRLAIGGNFIVVSGLYFTKGYAGDDPVINLRIDKNQLANNCRVTDCMIDGFNNPRMQENYWVSLSGKRNRIDHCSFENKNNLGVLMAVILDDDRSRENFHSVDHNYFGQRLPLGSNGGEIIRIGVSQHCEFNSNTQVTDNFFEHCDGETEIVSVKSCSNVVRNNLFKECQGSVVLRHGNYNTVENNIFLGNDKEGTGGVRIINKGQWVVNNYFYHCRGKGFRSPLSVMNGVPNSPANRYVAVTDAVIANNSFIECAPMSLCEGSDTERTVVPSHVIFRNNAYYNTKDRNIYDVSDDISKISFANNAVNTEVKQQTVPGFIKVNASGKNPKDGNTPFNLTLAVKNDSLTAISKTRLEGGFYSKAGYSSKNYKAVVKNAEKNCGASFYAKMKGEWTVGGFGPTEVKDATELVSILESKNTDPVHIVLTGTHYMISKPLSVNRYAIISTDNSLVRFSTVSPLPYLIELKGGASLFFKKFNADLTNVQAATFVTSDVNGSSDHSDLSVDNSNFNNLKGNFFTAAKSTMLDSVMVNISGFSNMKGTVFNFANENEAKGYYNAEKVRIINSHFKNIDGTIIDMLRGGNDESTLGPLLDFSKNEIEHSQSSSALMILNGTQRSFITGNVFTDAAKDGTLLLYIDAVRASHLLADNKFIEAGKIVRNKFVTEENNTTISQDYPTKNNKQP